MLKGSDKIMFTAKRMDYPKKHRIADRIKRIIITILSLLLVFCIGICVYVYRLLDKSPYIDIPVTSDYSVSEGILDDISDPNGESSVPSESGSSSAASSAVITRSPVKWGAGRIGVYYDSRFPIRKVEPIDPNVENILVFGVDARTAAEKRSRTDSIIIVSIDTKNDAIKLTSIMRDTQVRIEGRTQPNKINAAYVFGGIGLMINTINENFGLDIQRFAMLDMFSAEGIIDAVGGTQINVTKDEMGYLNHYLDETNRLFRDISNPSPHLEEPGLQMLNGRQTVAYGRIRYVGSDSARTQRQRNVLTQLIVRFKAAPVSSKLAVFDRVAGAFESNITKNEIVSLAFDTLAGMHNVQQYRIPESGMYVTDKSNYNLVVDMEKQIPALHAFIWGNTGKQLTSLPDEQADPTSTATPSPTSTATPSPTSAESSSAPASSGSTASAGSAAQDSNVP